MPAELSYQLAELILAESARGGLGPGSRLPTERRLAADMGATRTSIRHALAVLEAQGHISREVGRGTFLRHDPAQRGATGTGTATGTDGPGAPARGQPPRTPVPLRPAAALPTGRARRPAWPVRPQPASRRPM